MVLTWKSFPRRTEPHLTAFSTQCPEPMAQVASLKQRLKLRSPLCPANSSHPSRSKWSSSSLKSVSWKSQPRGTVPCLNNYKLGNHQCLLRVHYVPGTVLNLFYIFYYLDIIYLIVTTINRRTTLYSHITELSNFPISLHSQVAKQGC
jgi:hypothetical protein